ncbi:MAG: alpha/beta fold hydrolase [Herbiconiux sp.]|uniref:alpha/beta fold hydrolase n=1 Tax=Herbiconiux sp. TaxID=1871186 RepID=UPI00122936C4|nr:alpha/beta fold hydrolase [Herbiconiux sp.]TAJ47522.1 MAG: alpha/beta fold hydrolase [Herbiconiux sp.]
MNTRIIRRGAIIAAAVLLSALGVSGCTGTRSDSGQVSGGGTPAASVALVRGVEGFDDVYGQRIEWGGCSSLSEKAQAAFDAAGRTRDDRECARVSVPLDWDDSSSRDRIELAVVRYPATGPDRLGSLLVNPGGPGGDGQSLAARLAAEPRADDISAAYDLIGMDPRGIGESSPISCTADDETKPDNVLFAECLRDNPLTHHMDTSSVAKDLDALRYLLGDPALNYLGYSYGTALGATYASLFPHLVGRMVLDSAIDATWAGPINSFDQGEAIELASVELGESCVATNTTAFPCPWTDEEQLSALRDRLAETPWIASDGTEVGDTFFDGYLTTTNYKVNGERTHRLELIAGAAAGDQASIDAIASDHASSSVGLAGTIVMCFSQPVHPDLLALYDHVLERTGDRDRADKEVADLGSKCSLLEEEGTDFTESFDATGSAPILVIGVTGDHATPYDKAQSLVDQLGTAHLLTLVANQHGASYLKQNAACIDAYTTSYLLHGDLPPDGTVCRLDGA